MRRFLRENSLSLAFGLLFASSYFSVITPQGGSQNIIFAASGYLTQPELYKLGALVTLAFLAVYLLIGSPWGVPVIWQGAVEGLPRVRVDGHGRQFDLAPRRHVGRGGSVGGRVVRRGVAGRRLAAYHVDDPTVRRRVGGRLQEGH